MALTQIEVIAEESLAAGIAGLAEEFAVLDYGVTPPGTDGRQRHFLLVGRGDRQGLVDALQALLAGSESARIVLATVEATIPPEPEEEESEEAADEKRREALGATREELYSNVASGAELDSNFLLLTVLSTVVAAIGLIEDNVAVVIGAMVIAPLLGPNLAFSLGGALGDGRLMLRAMATAAAGLGLATLLGLAIGASHLSP